MDQLVIAVKNQAKFEQIRDALGSLDLELKSLAEFEKVKDFEVKEIGSNEVENAKLKAVGYARKLKETVLAMDNGLYLDGLKGGLQPGIHVRRIFGVEDERRVSDGELLAHISGVIRGLGGKADGYWKFAVCIANPGGKVYETVFDSPRKFVWKPSRKVIRGYPVDSLQKDPETQEYISEMGFKKKARFWERIIGDSLCEFVAKVQKEFRI